jgi:hypothetical protein
MVHYHLSPPADYVNIFNVTTSTDDYINFSRSFWAINVGGVFLCLTHILSAIFHFIPKLHKCAKPFQMLNNLCTLPYLIMATLWRFCEGGQVCDNNTNIYIDPSMDAANYVICTGDLATEIQIGLFMY